MGSNNNDSEQSFNLPRCFLKRERMVFLNINIRSMCSSPSLPSLPSPSPLHCLAVTRSDRIIVGTKVLKINLTKLQQEE